MENRIRDYLAFLEPFTLTLKLVAQMVHEADGTAVCWGMGVTQNIAGSCFLSLGTSEDSLSA
ncbi:Putative formate dehydrogenase yrhE [Listeria monocytogenes N53-1]|nr:Putative formate dehydrogenase yrhE [Listeria monocytogenes N53-1]